MCEMLQVNTKAKVVVAVMVEASCQPEFRHKCSNCNTVLMVVEQMDVMRLTAREQGLQPSQPSMKITTSSCYKANIPLFFEHPVEVFHI